MLCAVSVLPTGKAFPNIKAGLILSNLTAPEEQQLNLLDTPDTERQASIMQVLDAVNDRWGNNSLFYGGAGTARAWAMKRELRSQSYSTRLSEILVVSC
jgi:DNA polymerase V